MEAWKPVVGFEALYECSTKGNFRRVAASRGTRPNKPVKPYKGGGYLQVTFYKDKKPRRFYAHRVIAEAFIGPSDKEVNHKNGDRLDNRLKNLEYVTTAENLLHACRVLGVRRGAAHWNARMTEDDVREIYRLRKQGMLQHEIAAKFGLKRSTVAGILAGRQWAYLAA